MRPTDAGRIRESWRGEPVQPHLCGLVAARPEDSPVRPRIAARYAMGDLWPGLVHRNDRLRRLYVRPFGRIEGDGTQCGGGQEKAATIHDGTFNGSSCQACLDRMFQGYELWRMVASTRRKLFFFNHVDTASATHIASAIAFVASICARVGPAACLCSGAGFGVILVICTAHTVLVVPVVALLAGVPIVLCALILVAYAHFPHACALNNTLAAGLGCRGVKFIAHERAGREHRRQHDG